MVLEGTNATFKRPKSKFVPRKPEKPGPLGSAICGKRLLLVMPWRDVRSTRVRSLAFSQLVVEPTPLKNISQIGFIFPIYRGENKTDLKAPTSNQFPSVRKTYQYKSPVKSPVKPP